MNLEPNLRIFKLNVLTKIRKFLFQLDFLGVYKIVFSKLNIIKNIFLRVILSLGFVSILLFNEVSADAELSSFQLRSSIAEHSSSSRVLSSFYQKNNYQPIFLGELGKERVSALISSLRGLDVHGIPSSLYELDSLANKIRNSQDLSELGELEVHLSRRLLMFIKHMTGGVLDPKMIDLRLRNKDFIEHGQEISDQVDIDRLAVDLETLLDKFLNTEPFKFFKELTPSNLDYAGLLKEKKQLEKILSMGGFGPQVVAEEILRPGDTGPAVIALRNRLIRMGYLRRTIQGDYSEDLQTAVINFQLRNGLQPDGLSGAITLTEINRTAFDKLKLIYAGLERRRWLNGFEGKYILVNIPDYTLKVIDNTNVIYESRVVVGQDTPVTRTPEFSKKMSHMIVNPTWYVPKSLVLNEYLPELKQDRNAAIDLEFVDVNGEFVDRSEINFKDFDATSFPYGMRQQPSASNALGKIKFMLPNRHNIYLHDTPSKHLFSKESRAFSHGCIRVENPFNLAYTLLSIKTSNPDGLFDELKTSDKTYRLDLDEPMQVHIVYLTSWVDEAGNVNYRNDIYMRDEEIFASLVDIGLFNRVIVN